MKKPTGTILKILLLVCLIVVGNILAQWLFNRLDFALTPANEPYIHRFLMLSMAVYVVLTAIPFVPGVEIGLTVLMMFGPKTVVLVYVSTLAALTLSFLAGRLIPEPVQIGFLRDLGMKRFSRLLEDAEGLAPQERLHLMLNRSTRKVIPSLLKYRYLVYAVLINVPGNVIVGGGGGIALMAGMSRLFSPPMFLLVTAIAISPVPVLFLLFGNYLGRSL